MKRLLILGLLFVPCSVSASVFGIVNNPAPASVTSEGIFTLPLPLTDSTGNFANAAAGDSLWIIVKDPQGTTAVNSIVALADARIIGVTQGSRTQYFFRDTIANMDGSTAVNGTYTWIFWFFDKTTANIGTPFTGSFQLYITRRLSTTFDFVDAATTSRLAPTVASRTLDITAGGEAGIDLDNATGTLGTAHFDAAYFTASLFAASAITATVAPNLDAAISSRLAPTVAARTLDITAGGEAGIDLDNATGTLGTAHFDAAYFTAALFAADAITATVLATDAVGAAEFSAAAGDEIALIIWNYDSSTVTGLAGSAMGKHTLNRLNASVGSRSSHSALDVWNTAFATGFTAGTMGDSLNNASYVQGSASGLTARQIADTIFTTDSSYIIGLQGATDFGELLMTPTYVQGAAASVDSGLIARIVKRVWGIAQGSGSDSLTFAQRAVTTSNAVSVNDVISGALTDIEGAIWNAARSSHITVGSFGQGVASVQGNVTGNVSGSVGSVAGDVTGNLTGSVGSLAAAAQTNVENAVWNAVRASHNTAGTFGEGAASVQGNVTGSVASVTGAVGSVTGAVGSVTAGVTLTTAGIDAILDNTLANNTTGGSVAAFLRDTTGKAVEAARLSAVMVGSPIPGYADSSTFEFFPFDAANKDSVVYSRWTGGVKTRVTSWIFHHTGDVNIADTTRVRP